ncbi:hypothetical protein CALCODRAFT_480622 [Calocera cornea HHB12733]|uniref:Camp independent regulatory protein n=1 Tax=Calocera cornea HHB12733 TaxID=1353952 RepID=A0A165IG90_9BASI|nr:hypothetical protein CALCODRAFT_480622 [Calocera cornea HHB12733]
MRVNANASPSEQFRPFVGGWVRTTQDALLLFRAAKEGHINTMPRRLSDLEKVQLIRSGAIFIFEEKRSGIKRWTDSREWSPSRILGNYLIYRELDPNRPDRQSKGTSHASSVSNGKVRRGSTSEETTGPMRELLGSLKESEDFQKGGLMKKTITITFDTNTPHARAHHIISYYTPEDVLEGRLLPISKLALFQGMEPAHEWLDPTHFRYPPKIEFDNYGYRRYLGEADDEPVPTSPSRHTLAALSKHRGISYETARTPRSHSSRHVPYTRPVLTSHDSPASISSVMSTATNVPTVTTASMTPDGVDGIATPKHMPSLSPTSTSSTLSVTSPTEYTGPQSLPLQYYAQQMSYAYADPNVTGPELSSLPAIDHSAAPRPSPYYPAAFWPTSMAAVEDTKAANMHHLHIIAYEQQQAMYAPAHTHAGYAYAPAYDPYYPQPPQTASSSGAEDDNVSSDDMPRAVYEQSV